MLKKASLWKGWFMVAVVLFAAGSEGQKAATKDAPPKVIYNPDPEYTASARHDRVQGIVVVYINLDAQGIPHDAKVVKGLRSDLDKKAVEAVSKWRFSPAIKNGNPVPASVNVQVAFRLY